MTAEVIKQEELLMNSAITLSQGELTPASEFVEQFFTKFEIYLTRTVDKDQARVVIAPLAVFVQICAGPLVRRGLYDAVGT